MIKLAILSTLLTCSLFAQESPLETPNITYEDSSGSEGSYLVQGDSSKIANSGGFSFKAHSVELHTAMALFAQSAGLTLKTYQPLVGNRNVEFTNLDLNSAVNKILESDSIEWKIANNQLIIGHKPEPKIKKAFRGMEVEGDDTYRIITINYPRMGRTSNSELEGAVNGIDGRAAKVSLKSEDKVDFWAEIKEMITALVDENDKFSINYLTGVIYIQANTKTLNTIQNYLEKVAPILTRQVIITARIYEVILSEDNSLGVDWGYVDGLVGNAGLDKGISTSNGLTDSYKPNTILANLGFMGDKMTTTITALREQGEVRAVSQPRIITMHNQTAVVKVGTLYPYFTTTTEINAETGARTVTEEAELISLGAWISITPQISSDSIITLIVDPVLTDLTGTITSVIGSTAPIVDIKQSSSIVRINDRETVRISGLQQTKDKSIQRKIPLLGDIPILGALFRWSYETQEKKELVIFITTEVQ